MNRKDRRGNKTTYLSGNTGIRLICEAVAVELLFYAMLAIFRSAFGWQLPIRALGKLQVAMLVSLVLFIVGVPATGKYQRVCKVVLEIGYPAALVLFGIFHRRKLTESGKMLFQAYLSYWNKQYGTNYMTGAGTEMRYTYMLAFLLAVVVLLSLMFRYVTGVRLVLLLPDITALSVALLVNARLGWSGIALFFVGTVLVSAAPWTHMDVRVADGRTHVWMQLLSYAAAGVFAVILVSVSSYAFSGVAKQIPKKSPKFYAFQRQVEERVKNLTFSGITLQGSREHVDNTTPDYTGKTVFSIEASKAPAGKLYLKSFASGTYQNGTWVNEGKTFAHEVDKAGYHRSDVAMLMQQNAGELIKYISSSELAEDETQTVSYQISYRALGLKNAYMPYFSDSQTAGGKVWLRDDTVVGKKRATGKVSFEGLNENTDLRDVFDRFCMVHGETDTDLQQWYDAYADSRYRKFATDVPAVGDFITRRLALESIGYGVYEENGTYVADQMETGGLYDEDWLADTDGNNSGRAERQITTNNIRQNLATQVANWLGNENTYNLYLNHIPQGKDTIAYFLETGHEGYCMHFASAGALILQSLGVPARYASGYVVEPSAFHKEKKGYQADVPDYNAHAWVEIYLENIGWVPVEMTPGYTNDSAKLPTTPELRDTWKQRHEEHKDVAEQNPQTKNESPSETQMETQQQTESQMTEKEAKRPVKNNGKKNHTRDLQVFFAVCLTLAAAVLVLVLVAKWMRIYREQLLMELRNRQNRHAVYRINRRIYRGLHQRSFGMKTDADYLEKLMTTYPSVPAEDWKKYLCIVQKAVFSEEEISQEEARFCYRLYRKYRNRRILEK